MTAYHLSEEKQREKDMKQLGRRRFKPFPYRYAGWNIKKKPKGKEGT
jgi:hypothetical protein